MLSGYRLVLSGYRVKIFFQLNLIPSLAQAGDTSTLSDGFVQMFFL